MHAHSLRRPRKRRRVEPSEVEVEVAVEVVVEVEAEDAPPSPMSEVDDSSDKSDEEEAAQDAAVDAEGDEESAQEEGGEEEVQSEEDDDGEEHADDAVGGGGRRRSGARDQRPPPPERWRESALYREAQRHAGTPNARKTHRQLGIFGLRGFPAELEHMRDFELPEWALPSDDLRLVVHADADAVSAVPVVVVGERKEQPHDVGVGSGEEGKEETQLDAAVVMAVTGAEDGDKTLLEVGPDKSDSDPMVTVETPKTVDSQETEDLMLFV